MSLVAISQTLGSLGDEIGRRLAQTLAYRFADREIILQAAQRFGEVATDLEHATDEKPTLWERVAGSRRQYRTYVEAIIWEWAAPGQVVLVGRGSVFALQSVPHALRVRITAPDEVRARRLQERDGLTAEAARQRVRESARERAARIKFLYDVDWETPTLYDVMLNTDRVPVPVAVELLRETLRGGRFQPTEDARREVADRSLTVQALAALLAHPVTRALRLAVECRDGEILLRGTVDQEKHQKTAEALLAGLPGVTGVQSAIVFVPSRPGTTMV